MIVKMIYDCIFILGIIEAGSSLCGLILYGIDNHRTLVFTSDNMLSYWLCGHILFFFCVGFITILGILCSGRSGTDDSYYFINIGSGVNISDCGGECCGYVIAMIVVVIIFIGWVIVLWTAVEWVSNRLKSRIQYSINCAQAREQRILNLCVV